MTNNSPTTSISDKRLDCFHVGQVWQSPKGSLYRVVEVKKGGQAKLRMGVDGSGRAARRDWDAVINWVLHSDS